MIDLIKELPDIQGCCLLTPTGTLGCYRADRRFYPDPALRAALAALVEQWLREDRDAADTRRMRLGVVFADRRDPPWRTTLALDDEVLRRLHPVTVADNRPAGDFPRRQREHSIFRGMELLLDYRDPAMADIPYYCPVLVNRGTTLAHYLPWPERPRRAGDDRVIAVEVIDLLAGRARSQRRVPGVAELVAAERAAVVHPERRRA